MSSTRITIPDPELIWRGDWDPEITYPPESVVGYEGSSYVSTDVTVGAVPNEGSPWNLLAARGEQGIKGDPGISGDAASRIPPHVQSVSATVWHVTHNLGFDPAVEVIDSAGSRVITEVVYVTPGVYLEIRNKYPFLGKAILT